MTTSFTQRVTIPTLPFHNTVIRSFEGPLKKKNVISVMNFNLLAECYSSEAVNQMMPFDTERRRLNSLHVQHIKPMILVVEEMDACYIEDFESFGYETVLATKKEGKGEHTGLFFLKEAQIKSLCAEVHKVDRKGEMGQFLIICHALCTLTNTEFVIICTHAKAGRTEEFENARVDHAKYTFEHILPEFLKRRSEAMKEEKMMNLLKKVLYVGDFNAGPHSYGGKYPCKIIPWLLGEKIIGAHDNNEDNDAFGQNPIRLVSAQKILNGNQHPLFTTCKERDGAVIVQTIDYVLMSEEFGTVVGGLETPSANPEKDLAPHYLPCPGKWGSDHLSVYVEIEMK